LGGASPRRPPPLLRGGPAPWPRRGGWGRRGRPAAKPLPWDHRPSRTFSLDLAWNGEIMTADSSLPGQGLAGSLIELDAPLIAIIEGDRRLCRMIPNFLERVGYPVA